jgi:hypothetical protein
MSSGVNSTWVTRPVYLGDSVYIQRNAMYPTELILTLGSHEPLRAETAIYLEKEVVKKLVAYLHENGYIEEKL